MWLYTPHRSAVAFCFFHLHTNSRPQSGNATSIFRFAKVRHRLEEFLSAAWDEVFESGFGVLRMRSGLSGIKPRASLSPPSRRVNHSAVHAHVLVGTDSHFRNAFVVRALVRRVRVLYSPNASESIMSQCTARSFNT
jgi:hypothetical protein